MFFGFSYFIFHSSKPTQEKTQLGYLYGVTGMNDHLAKQIHFTVWYTFQKLPIKNYNVQIYVFNMSTDPPGMTDEEKKSENCGSYGPKTETKWQKTRILLVFWP